MRRRAVLVAAATAPLFAGTGPAAAAAPVLPSRAEVRRAVRRVNDAWLHAVPVPGDNGWAWSTYMVGNVAAYRLTRDRRYLRYARTWAEQADYRLRGGRGTRDANSQLAGEVYYDLRSLAPEPGQLTEIKASVHRMAHGAGAGREDDWDWVDALHMAMPVFARAAMTSGDPRLLTTLHEHYGATWTRLWSPPHRLWFRDGRYVQAAASAPPTFWLRGNGWAAAGQVRTLVALRAGRRGWPRIARNAAALAEVALHRQRPDGFWNADLRAGATHRPGRETSGTALLTYALATGIRYGWLDRRRYLPVVARAWHGLTTVAVQPDGLVGYVQGPGEAPGDHQPVGRADTTEFGVGAFLSAGAAVAALTR